MFTQKIQHLIWMVILPVLAITFIPGTHIFAQQFGQNKVQYDQFNWSFIRSDHFDVYFYKGGKDLASFTAETAEKALQQISQELSWKLTKRVSIIVYESHNDFQQTNVTRSSLPEGIGGFTELFKNRMVLPFEGDYEKFRHVIHHELTHAVMNDFLYGGSIQSIVSGRVTVQLPLWMSEGYAEFSSLYWDTKTDMTIRDLAINGQIPELYQLNGYMAYRGGQAVMKYISDTYGKPKIGEMFNQIKSRRSVEAGMKEALGGDMKEVSKRWRKWVRKQYWPDINGRDEIADEAIQLTDHDKLKNYYNIAPAISPDGSKIAILSDRDGYADIFFISSVDGEEIRKVVSGGRTPDLEELQWLQAGITWAPDSKRIAFTSKAGASDALNIIDLDTGDRHTYKTSLEGMFMANWSPQGDKIALVGLKGSNSNIYVFDVKTHKLSHITDDMFSDSSPVWSPDGTRIAFVSDRGNHVDGQSITMADYNFTNNDIYIYSVATQRITRVTDSPSDENYPAWSSSGNKLAYASDRSGVYNIYIRDLSSSDTSGYAITNVLTGIQQLSWSTDDSKLVFSGYKDGGWDVYVLTNPLDVPPDSIHPPLTNWRKEENAGDFPKIYSIPGTQITEVPAIDSVQKQTASENARRTQGGEYSRFIFAPGYDWRSSANDSLENLPPFEDTLKSKNAEGEYVAHKYKTRFTLDLVNSQAAYNTFFGFQGSTVFMFSDILGNHQVSLATDLFVDLQNSSYYLNYMYLKHRTDYGVSVFNFPNFFRVYPYGLIRYRNYGGIFMASYPFSKFTRVDFNTLYYNVEMRTLEIPENDPLYRKDLIETIIPSVSFVYDNTIWGYTGPHDGTRLNVSYTQSPKYTKNSLSFQTGEIDFRRYWMINREYSMALRFAGGASNGPNAQRFFVGGESNWINQKFRTNLDEFVTNPENIYFSKFVTPVRGSRYYERAGTRYAVLNAEFRFPFIQYFITRFPLPLFFQNIRGAMFWDTGAAWNGWTPNVFTNRNGRKYFKDVISGYGYGVRIGMGYFLLKIDVAWSIPNLHIFSDASKPKYYFSLGLDF